MSAHVEFDDGATLFIPSSVMTGLSRMLAARGFARESGGILLGRQVEGALVFELTSASSPSKHDIGQRFSFLRRMRPANKLISAAWHQSNGTINYLGEWHTHNENNPIPSATDRKLVKQVVTDGSCPLSRCFMLIVGNSGDAYVGAANPIDDKGIYCERRIKWER